MFVENDNPYQRNSRPCLRESTVFLGDINKGGGVEEAEQIINL